MNNLLQALIPLTFAALTLPAAPAGYVLDEAELLSPETELSLEAQLSTLEADTSTEMVVVTVDSLQGYPIEQFALELGRTWGVGQEEFNNGLILLVAPTEREVRIEVGYGLEGAVTDAQSSSIISKAITPQFSVGNYEGGIQEGVNYLEKLARGETFEFPELTTPPIQENPWDLLIVLIVMWPFIGSFLYMFAASKAWWVGGLVGAGVAFIVFSSAGMMLVGLGIGLLLDFVLSRFFYKKLKNKAPKGGNHWGGPRNGSGGGFGGGGFGSSGGGFGGGSFGGGGASGRW